MMQACSLVNWMNPSLRLVRIMSLIGISLQLSVGSLVDSWLTQTSNGDPPDSSLMGPAALSASLDGIEIILFKDLYIFLPK